MIKHTMNRVERRARRDSVAAWVEAIRARRDSVAAWVEAIRARRFTLLEQIELVGRITAARLSGTITAREAHALITAIGQ